MDEEGKRSFSSLEELDEKIIQNKPWALKLLKMATSVTKKGVLNWCNVINKIGESEMVIDDYISIFIKTLEQMYEDLIFDVDIIHEKMLDKIMQLLQSIENKCIDLHTEIPQIDFENIPLCDIRNALETKNKEYEEKLESRRREIRDLNNKQANLCKALGRKATGLGLERLPSQQKIDEMRAYLETLECEKMEREERFLQLKEEIGELMAELEMEPETEFEKKLFSLSNVEVLITDQEMEQLDLCHKLLNQQSKTIKTDLFEIRNKVDSLWDKLEVDIGERSDFCLKHKGNTLKTLKAFKEELKRCEQLKAANIKLFIDKQRIKLREMWDKCHCNPDEEMQKFCLYNSTCYNEDLLELHDMEVEKWNNYYEENIQLFQKLEEYNKLWKQWLELEAGSTGADRYNNRGGRLLQEEKQRNKLQRLLPNLETKVVQLAEAYEQRKGEPFIYNGLRIADYIENLKEEHKRDAKLKLSAKKQIREQSTLRATPLRNCTKRKLITTPATERSKRAKTVVGKTAPATCAPKLNINKMKRLEKAKRRSRHRLSFKSPNVSNKENKGDKTAEYIKFENELSHRLNWRSTEVGLKDINATEK